MSKKIIVFVIALIIVVGVTGVIVLPQFFKPEEAVAGPISVIDDVGRNVTITGYPPERIVSLAPSCTEILFALGLGDKVVGVDELSDYPLEVQERVEAGDLTTVGSFSEISMELVVGLEPDLILATGGVQRVVVESLEGLDQTVVVLYPERFDGVLADISLVGEATGQIDEAEALVADMQERAQEIADKTQGASRPRVYIEFAFNGGYRTFGSGSFADEIIYKAGGKNVFADSASAYMATSTEEVIVSNPEIIIIAKGAMSEACGLSPETINNRPGWNAIYAVKNNQIYEIDERLLLPSPAMIDCLESIAEIMHPELFEEV